VWAALFFKHKLTRTRTKAGASLHFFPARFFNSNPTACFRLPNLMSAATASAAQSGQIQPRHKHRVLSVAAILLAAVVLAVIIFANSRWWPFSEQNVLEELQESSDSQVHVRHFSRTYFPSPGCILQGLVLTRSANDATPFIAVRTLKIEGSYPGIIWQSIRRMTIEGLVISFPALGTGKAFHTTSSKITVGEIVANDAAVEFATHEPGNIIRFDIHQATLRNVGWSKQLSYRVTLHNPEPPGEITADGKFGPWNRTTLGETPVSGKYAFDQADLSFYKAIAGTLSSTGNFSGILSHIDVSGTTDVPNFEVVMGHHPVRLQTKFSAYVDATGGNTFLKRVDADLRHTHIVAKGSIAKSPNGKGKTGLLDLEARQARIEDLLGLFVKANRSPMAGTADMHAHVQVPPGDDFLKKIRLQGTFGVGKGSFSDPSTQKDVDSLSAGAQGKSSKEKENPETVLAFLEGNVGVADGTAQFSDLFFQIPGAHVRLHGTYSLINYKIDMRGRMRVDSKISQTTSGPKSFLLKMMDPIFKKKKKGEIVPVRISGTYDHPTFGLDLNDKKHTSKQSFTLH
jgi:hypothetical protein